MHAAALRALGLPHSYEALRVTASELPASVQSLRDGVFAGLNVTVPHKTQVLALADLVHDSARRVGAANTLVRAASGHVVAYNTDAPALERELADLVAAPSWAEAQATVLGSGGAARAAVAALDALGVRSIVVRARSARPAFDVRPGVPLWQPWAPDRATEASTRVVIQATSAGMAGADPGEAAADVVAWSALPQDASALDVVYAPDATPFLDAARRRGLRAAGGLGMLARQGALALELWLGCVAPLDVMRAAIAAPRT